MKPKVLMAYLCLFILMSALAGCGSSKTTAPTPGGRSQKLVVYASFYPMYDFTKKIGGDLIEVRCLVPAGAEPHDWEPKAKDLASLQKADLFIYNGQGMEPWLAAVQGSLQGSKCVFVDTSAGISLIKPPAEEEGHGGDKHGHESDFDPHIWLDPLRAKQQAANIKTALIKASPANQAAFEANYNRFANAIDELDAQYRAVVSQTSRKDFVVTEPAFGYLADRYGLKQVGVLGVCTEGEPSPGELKKIVDFAKKNQVKHIFFESMYSPKVAQTLAREVGAKTLVLSAVHGLTEEDIKNGQDYLTAMRANLENLKIALQN